MNFRRLILRNLWYYRRSFLAVLTGVIVSTAVLTGALIVGDSVRYSLSRITDQRLGKIRFAVIPGERLFRQELATEIAGRSNTMVVPILGTEGIAISNENNTRINRVDVTGINSDFTALWHQPALAPEKNEAVLSLNAAERLGVKQGDEILLRVQPVDKASPNAPFVPDRTEPVALRLRIKALAGDDELGRFSLKREQSAPINVFVNLVQLTSRLQLAGMANGLLLAADAGDNITSVSLDSLISQVWQPADAGLQINALEEAGWYDITSDRIFLSDEQSQSIRASIPGTLPVLTYMVNSINSGERTTPYSFVTAADSGLLKQVLGSREILINQWLADDLKAVPGDLVKLSYWVMGPMRSLREESARFFVKSVIPVDAVPSGQRLMPDFPGMSEAGNCRDWETGSPVDLSKIRDKDEAYWNDYRGTPKAFISLETGKKLWANAFGTLTAFRFKAASESLPQLTHEMMRQLIPAQNGLVFRPVYAEGKEASIHSTDFGQLFLGLSFFIIAAALLIMALLFSMQITGRMSEAGVLSANGFRRQLITRMLIGEGLLVAFTGSIAGAALGIPCNTLLLAGLNTVWYDAVQTSSLVACIKPVTLMTGAFSGLITASLVMIMVLWRKLKQPVAMLVKGAPKSNVKTGLHRPRNIAAAVLLALGTFAIIVTGANQKSVPGENSRKSGTGGFLLWTETTLPVLEDLNKAAGKNGFSQEDEPALRGVTYIPLQRLEGDDASCLNLNRVSNPPLLAVPAALFDSLGAFSFAAFSPGTDPAHPWKVLTQKTDSGIINAFADMTVITWGLQKKIGDTLFYMDEKGNKVLIRLSGGLKNSLFQGNILIADSRFRSLYPSVSGARLMLIDGPEERMAAISARMEALFRDYGMMALPATAKLASFNAVENTYLSVFMMLGALGMIIGTIGLGIILWRNIQERQYEFALLRALGHPGRRILRRITGEYLVILLSGIFSGLAAALAVLLPGFLAPGDQFPYVWVTAILALIFISGIAWIWFPAREALKKDIIPALRNE